MKANDIIDVKDTQGRALVTEYARQWVIDALNKYRKDLQQQYVQRRSKINV